LYAAHDFQFKLNFIICHENTSDISGKILDTRWNLTLKSPQIE